MKDLGPLSYFLGIQGHRHPSGLFLEHSIYAKQILVRVGMLDCKPYAAPSSLKSNPKPMALLHFLIPPSIVNLLEPSNISP